MSRWNGTARQIAAPEDYEKQQNSDMTQDFQVFPDKRHNWKQCLHRFSGYTLRGGIAAVALVIVCVAGLISLPFALFDYRNARRKRHNRMIPPDIR